MGFGKIFTGIVVGVVAVAAVPFTGGGSLLAGAAALGLGTTAAVVAAGVAATVGGVVGGLWDDDIDDENAKRKLGIIGMKGSGKSTLLHKLGGIKIVKSDTFIEQYEEFSHKTMSGKTINISKGKDIGGLKNYMSEYKSVVDESDVVFYFFDVNLYVNNVEYRRECNSRLSFIFPQLKNKKAVLLATHLDDSNLTKSELREIIMQNVTDKVYSNLFNENFFILDLTDDKQFKDLINNLFP
jgi:ribosome biogenesis GTPase A